MSRAVLQTVLRAVRGPDAGDDPAAALRRFAAGDADAFAALVGRHGPMVYGVCRRVLGPTADAEDAFQATFLALARRARALRDAGALPGWLHRTALNAALKAKASRGSAVGARPEPAAADDPLAEASWREVRRVLDEELNALPAGLRGPLVACYLEARVHADAARGLGISVSTLKRRLERGRELLRRRLVRRGVGAAGLAAAVLGPGLVSPVHAALYRRAALLARAGADVRPAVTALAGARHLSPRVALTAAGLMLAGLSASGLFLAAPVGPPNPAEPPAAETPAPATAKGTRIDRLDDPLPEGAVARLGTSRLRTARYHRFTPDGRQIVVGRADGDLQAFDVPYGKPRARFRAADVPGRTDIVGSTLGFSPDGKYLAAVCWEGRCGIWEVATGRLVRWLESGNFFSIVECDFSPDGKLLAAGSGTPDNRTDEKITVAVYEVASGKRLFATSGSNSVFAPDGRSLVVWNGYNNPRGRARRVAVPVGQELGAIAYEERYPDFTPRSDGVWFFEVAADHAVRVWDVASGKVKHTFRGPAGGEREVVYVRHARGRRELIAVGTGPASGIWCWDLDTGKELWKVRLDAPAYFPKLSADGATLSAGDAAGNVRVWDAATGKERARFRPRAIGHDAHDAGLSADGKTVVTASGGDFSHALAFWDAATGKLLTDLPGHPSGITAAAFAPDGTRLYTVGKDRTLRTWDPATGRELAHVAAEPAAYLAASPDGKALYAAAADGGPVRVLDPRTGKVLRQFPAFAKSMVGMALTADGRRLVAAGRDAEAGPSLVRFLDPATGTKLAEFSAGENTVEQLAVRPDGGAAATTHPGRQVTLRDAGGKVLLRQSGHGGRQPAWTKKEVTPHLVGSVGLSPDGRWLAYSDQEQGVAVVDLRTGREAGRARPDVYYQDSAARDEVRNVLAFAPDGKTLAWSGVESTAEVFLIEVRTRQVRRRLPGDSQPVQHLLFSPDGSKLLSAGPDGSALVWDVFGNAPGAAPPGAAAAGWWDALEDRDAAKADRAMREMAARPNAAVVLLREKMRPVKATEAAKLDALLAWLDAPAFKDREAAVRGLAALGDAAEPQLRELLRRAPGPELKRRAEEALDRIEAVRLRPERAVEVLERVGDAAAVRLLRELAGGMPGAALTADAAGALARVRKRAPAP
jgi:RNA polymerase sigma factor (sigma-70 family)